MPYSDLIINSKKAAVPLKELQYSEKNRQRLEQFLNEFRFVEELRKFDLPVDNKLLFHGPSGCGKTATAKALAGQLGKKIIVLALGGLVSSKLGETAKNMTTLFNKASHGGAILFLDEFDSIGKMRDYDQKDSSEMKRLVNTIIQLIDHLPDEALLIAATNHVEAIDHALMRRFQMKLEFELPAPQELDKYYDQLLEKYPEPYRDIERAYNISYAEAKDIVHAEVKSKMIQSLAAIESLK